MNFASIASRSLTSHRAASRASATKTFCHVLMCASSAPCLVLLCNKIRITHLNIFPQVSGGIIVTYTIATIGMAWCAGTPGGNQCGAVFQAFISSAGCFLFALNAAVMVQRWRSASTLTRCVSELLTVLGVPLKRQLCVKVTLSALLAVVLAIDVVLAWLIHLDPPDPRNKGS